MKAYIFAENEMSIVDRCYGPNWAGCCPKAEPGCPVPCAGRKLLLVGEQDATRAVLSVEPDILSCPLGVLRRLGLDGS